MQLILQLNIEVLFLKVENVALNESIDGYHDSYKDILLVDR